MDALRGGQIGLTGSLVKTRLPAATDRYRFELGGIGAVSLAVVE
jgi:2-keto-4-pentenoate hydratase